jgi:glycosyltransferase involved in cell wall biosynthesis
MLTGEYPPRRGGVGDYTARLSEALRELGVPVTVLTSVEPGSVPAGAPAARREVANWGFGCWRPVLTALDASGARVLHIQYQAGAFQLHGAVNLLPLWLRRRRPRVRVVTTFHDLLVPYLFPKAGRLRPLAVRLLLSTSQGAIFADPADLARAGPGPNRRWIPVGSNLPCRPPADYNRARVRAALGAGPDDLLIGYFGFLSASKGAADLLRAVRLLLDRGRPVRLALIGAGAGASNATDQADQQAAEALAARLGLGLKLVATGYLEPEAVSAHLLACDLLALPYRDGASFRRGSLLAALEHGRPIVSTPPAAAAAGTGPRRLVPGQQFLAAPPGDPAALAEAIASLADRPDLAAQLAAEASALAAQCSWPAIATETAEVYRRCFEPGTRPERA